MMSELSKPLELVEKVILEPGPTVWATFSIGGCGIIARVLFGKHDEALMNSKRIAFEFAKSVINTIGLSFVPTQVITPQVLVEMATTVINDNITEKDSKLVNLTCTTWRHMQEGLEISSVGTNSVLIFHGNKVHEAFPPHSVNVMLRSQGDPPFSTEGDRIPTNVLDVNNSCSVDDIRVAHIPLLPETTVAIIVDPRLAKAILQQEVSRNELPSFVEAWMPPNSARRIRTSVLLSL